MTSEASDGTRRIVVGVDGSQGGRHALAWAVKEAETDGARLEAVHAWEPPVPASEALVMVDIDPAPYEQAGAEELSEVVAGIGETTVDIQPVLLRGHPAWVLLDHARDADLLVVGSRGRGGFAGLLLGSISQRCAQHAEGPVAVVPATAEVGVTGEVVVGVDGSEPSWAALRWAVGAAARRSVPLCVVHAWTTPVAVPPIGISVAPRDTDAFRAESERLLHDMVDATLARVGQQPASLELLPIEAPAAAALLDRAQPGDLLVVGSRGRGAVAGLLLGSVSQQCVTHARGAVVVVPSAEP